MVSVLVPLAQGCEELEAITIVDLLRRAEIQVITAALTDGPVTASRGSVLIADMTLDEAIQKEFDMVVLPGGLPGADNLDNDERIRQLLLKMAHDNKYTAAICAAPKVLASAGLLAGKTATGYPGTLEKLALSNTTISDGAVVIDGLVITSKGPGTAMDFSLQLIELLVGKSRRDSVEAALQRP
jgi:4-methyl-5(b-hydroxyethyl)-thiazole monophosphate biosynthesis